MVKKIVACDRSSTLKSSATQIVKNEDRLLTISIYSLTYLAQNSHPQSAVNASHTSSVMMMHGSLRY